jgi:hypothetical protein
MQRGILILEGANRELAFAIGLKPCTQVMFARTIAGRS